MKRLGVQSLASSTVSLGAVMRGKPAVFKVVEPDAGWVSALHHASPATTLIGRIVDDSLTGKLTEGEGRKFADRVLHKSLELEGIIRWWEGSNEAASGPDAIERLNEFEYAFAKRIEGEGLKALVGGFSTGTPQIVGPNNKYPWMYEWSLIYPAIKVASGVHVHEYWHPYLLSDTWNAYRYRRFYPELPDWAQKKWWLVSELGVDGMLAGHGRSGWRNYMQPLPYVELLTRYAEAMRGYERFAATVYIAGLGYDPSWRTYDVAGEVLNTIANRWVTSNPRPWGAEDDPSPPQLPSEAAWDLVTVAHAPTFALPTAARRMLGPLAFAVSHEFVFHHAGESWVGQLWTDRRQVKLLATIRGQWDKIVALP